MRLAVAVWVLSLSSSAWADCVDPLADPLDCDGDGWTVAAGDCDDENNLVAPDVAEICGDGVDQDCASGADDGCALRDGELIGGTGCGARGGWAGLVLAPLLLLCRRWSR